MNGKHSNNCHKSVEEEVKRNSFISFSHRPSLETISKRSEAERISKSQRHSTFDISELRNRPEMLKRLLDAAIQIEKDKTTGFTYELNFSIAYNTKFGERIVVTGDPEFLGKWDPLRGLELEWSPGNIWKVNILIAEGIINDFEYKYVCINPCSIIWEFGVNRSLKISEGIKNNSHIVFKKEDYWQNNL
ncbi:hypothetical protein SteCoe_24814 [Stentor coeruleus]|uniref:CBM20 domain-containing protein n=1 Tax=Stentor coeruleus TaxID=5963 RepID=A0A1R2BGQ6_9CILI|nr:hypothetical protein SteCoe_24814 [Stentor coeruleus]